MVTIPAIFQFRVIREVLFTERSVIAEQVSSVVDDGWHVYNSKDDKLVIIGSSGVDKTA
jgi:hypothetical protein